MRIEDPGWAPLPAHEWPEHARLTEPEGETVKIVPVTGHRLEREPAPYIHVPRPEPDDGTRLDTYQARRLRDLMQIGNEIDQALALAEKAKIGADGLARLEAVVAKLDEMISAGWEALDLLAHFRDAP